MFFKKKEQKEYLVFKEPELCKYIRELHDLIEENPATICTRYGERRIAVYVTPESALTETQFYVAYTLTNGYPIFEIEINKVLHENKKEVTYAPKVISMEEGQTYKSIVEALREGIDKIREQNKVKFNLANEILKNCQ